MKASELLDRHAATWRKAIRHPFLDEVREGTLPDGAFERWLTQDYLFVTGLLAFQARLLARAPRRDQAVLAGGLIAMEAELGWFEEHAAERSLALDDPLDPANVLYRDFLRELETEPYAAGITALWALELTYLEAWRGAAPGAPGYRPFVERWTTPEFANYVTGLEEAATSALRAVGEGESQRAEAAFVEVARLEEGFWEMAFPEGRA